nr:MAG TPA: hypothetical protein [Caudoviricetes sp.]
MSPDRMDQPSTTNHIKGIPVRQPSSLRRLCRCQFSFFIP